MIDTCDMIYSGVPSRLKQSSLIAKQDGISSAQILFGTDCVTQVINSSDNDDHVQDGAVGQGDVGMAAQRLQALFNVSTEEADGGGNESRQLGAVYPPARRPSMAAMLDSLADSEDTIQQRPRADANARAIKHRWDALSVAENAQSIYCA